MKTRLIDGFFVYRYLRLADIKPIRPYFIKRIIEVAKKGRLVFVSFLNFSWYIIKIKMYG